MGAVVAPSTAVHRRMAPAVTDAPAKPAYADRTATAAIRPGTMYASAFARMTVVAAAEAVVVEAAQETAVSVSAIRKPRTDAGAPRTVSTLETAARMHARLAARVREAAPREAAAETPTAV